MSRRRGDHSTRPRAERLHRFAIGGEYVGELLGGGEGEVPAVIEDGVRNQVMLQQDRGRRRTLREGEGCEEVGSECVSVQLEVYQLAGPSLKCVP